MRVGQHVAHQPSGFAGVDEIVDESAILFPVPPPSFAMSAEMPFQDLKVACLV